MSAPEVFLPLNIVQMGYVQQVHGASLAYPVAAQLHAAQHAVQLLKQQAKQIQKTEKSDGSNRVRKDGDSQEERRARSQAKTGEQALSPEEAAVGAHDDSPWAGKFINRNI